MKKRMWFLNLLLLMSIIVTSCTQQSQVPPKTPTKTPTPAKQIQVFPKTPTKAPTPSAIDLCRDSRIALAKFPVYLGVFNLLGTSKEEFAKLLGLHSKITEKICSKQKVDDLQNIPEVKQFGEQIIVIVNRFGQQFELDFASSLLVFIYNIGTFTNAYNKICNLNTETISTMSDTEFEIYIDRMDMNGCFSRLGLANPGLREFFDGMKNGIDNYQSLSSQMGTCFKQARLATRPQEDCSSLIAEEQTPSKPDDPPKEDHPEEKSEEDTSETELQTNMNQNPGEGWEILVTVITHGIVAAAATASGPIGTVAAVGAVLNLVKDIVDIQLKYKNLNKDCFVYSPAADFNVPFTMGEDKLPPSFLDVYNNCRCKTQIANLLGVLDQSSSIGKDLVSKLCPTSEDRKRMDCITDPWGPDDGPRFECVKQLEVDNIDFGQRMCPVMSCPENYLIGITKNRQCACVSKTDVARTLPNGKCQNMLCDGHCVCENKSICSCGYVETVGPIPVTPPPGKPTVTPPPPPPGNPPITPMPTQSSP